jgi:predicted amidohydrolase YtcJ
VKSLRLMSFILTGITIDAAYASFSEETLGSLSPGKLADYVVLSQDIMTVPVKDILAVKVLATVVDGKPVYGRI